MYYKSLALPNLFAHENRSPFPVKWVSYGQRD